MHYATETIATEDTSVAPLFRRRHRRTCRTGWREGQRSMRPLAVVLGAEAIERALLGRERGSRWAPYVVPRRMMRCTFTSVRRASSVSRGFMRVVCENSIDGPTRPRGSGTSADRRAAHGI